MLECFNSISLDKESKTPLYLQLFEQLKALIAKGVLPPDCRLPSIRQLSVFLKVNCVTVVTAFKELENNDLVYSKPGSGTYVSKMTSTVMNDSDIAILDELYQNDGLPLLSNDQMKVNENTIDFASATPTPDLFPVEDFRVALNDVLGRDKGAAFSYQDSAGFYPLRECVSEILKNTSINCSPESIQIISGAQQGIDIISKAFLSHGDYVITESPTYTGAIAVFKSRGAQIADVPMEKDGCNLNILEYQLKTFKPKFIYTIPSFHNPTGYSYSNNKREQLIKLAEKYKTYIIEDSYVSDLDFEDSGFTPLKTLDKNGRVIYIKSFSKIFMPGLRLGFMIVPKNLRPNTLEAKHATDISTSGLLQRAFDLYIRNGFWDKHFEFMHGIYKERYQAVISALDRSLPSNIKYVKPGGGLNIWLELPYGFPVSTLLNQAVSSNIVFAPGRVFYNGNSPMSINNIRISFAAVHTGYISGGIEKLCEIIKGITNESKIYSNIRIL